MEFLNRNPDVVQVYDAITEKDVQDVIKLAKENVIAPSTVLGILKGQAVTLLLASHLKF